MPVVDQLPLVTVIIPNYNNERFLEDCLDSVFNQSYPFLQVVVIDDGSTDNSLQLLERYKNPIQIISQENRGVAAARNAGLKQADGKYIAFLDGDDIFLPNKLSHQVAVLEKMGHEYGLCFTDYKKWKFDKSGQYPYPLNIQLKRSFEIDDLNNGWLYKQLIFSKEKSLVCTDTVMLRKSVLDNVGLFDERLKIGEDIDYWLRISKNSKLVGLKGVYALYRANGESLTHKINKKNYNVEVFLKNIEKKGDFIPLTEKITDDLIQDHLFFLWFRHGYFCFWKECRKLAFDSFINAIRSKPFQLRAIAYFLLSSNEYLYRMALKFKRF